MTRRRLEHWGLPLLASAVLVSLWHLAVVQTGTKVFPSPAAVVRGLGELLRRGVLGAYLLDSLRRVALGTGLAVLLGVPLGSWMGLRREAALAMDPVVQWLRPISPLAWSPLAIVLWGVGEPATVFLIFLAAIFPLTTAATSAVQAIPEVHLRAGRNFGLGPGALWLRVLLPASIPDLLVALRITLGIAWLVVVAAEMLAVDSGLGYLIIDARNAGKRYDLVVAGMLLIGCVGWAIDAGVRRLERLRPVRWGFPEQ
ncbi:ABC transporter permease [Corallococcus sp. H22C18031201]|nr:ABC transporter permease [Corallococcus sp. H22C18031201]